MKEQVSALMDGELEGPAADATMNSLGGEGDSLEAWRTYHLISDAMRDTRLLSAGFAARFAQQLEQEPTVLAPANLRRASAKRFALAAAASVAGVGLVGWLAFAPEAQRPQPVAKMQTIPLPSATNDYLLAHQGFSPRVSLQGMAPYVRTVAEHPGETSK